MTDSLQMMDIPAPTANWQTLRLRADLLGRLRAFFTTHGFLEVETPVLSSGVVIDRHLEPFSTKLAGNREQGNPTLWLQTSPEAAMKRLMVAGGEAIYQVARSFRRGEQGRFHNPEFTIVEWYRRGDSMDQGIGLLSDMCDALLGSGPAERICYREAFDRYAQLDPFTTDVPQLAVRASSGGLVAPGNLGHDLADWLELLFVEFVQPHLGVEIPTIVYDYPASIAALAKVRCDDHPVAERFELFVHGVELANGYHELRDAQELKRRMWLANAQRVADGREVLPEPTRLVRAMEQGLPECTGVALGFDRLVMLAANVRSIAQVMAFTIDSA